MILMLIVGTPVLAVTDFRLIERSCREAMAQAQLEGHVPSVGGQAGAVSVDGGLPAAPAVNLYSESATCKEYGASPRPIGTTSSEQD
jgi:hypothetical protein